ncbi:hypothetical protein ACJX0J_037748, partial [Zea mays]
SIAYFSSKCLVHKVGRGLAQAYGALVTTTRLAATLTKLFPMIFSSIWETIGYSFEGMTCHNSISPTTRSQKENSKIMYHAGMNKWMHNLLKQHIPELYLP